MKSIILIVAVAFSGVCYGQSETELDSASMALINEAVNELETWKQTTKTFKTGDDDRALIGLLEYLFFDDTIKYMYAKLNPKIAELEINGFQLDRHWTYDQWINSIHTLDPNKHDVIYRFQAWGPGSHMETLIITSKETGEELRDIVIYYNDNNLRSIFDQSVK